MGLFGWLYRSAKATVVFWVVISLLALGVAGAVTVYDSTLGDGDGFETEQIDEEQVEDEVQAQVNEIRANSSLIVLEHDRDLHEQSESHTQRMAENEMLSHQIGRSTAEDRLGLAGCGYGSENIIQSWANEEVDIPDHENIRTDDAEALAEALVASWMSSEGHRENILTSEWRSTSVSVEITNDDKVYATQMFCE
jgi:uncharacterized protein YkwD